MNFFFDDSMELFELKGVAKIIKSICSLHNRIANVENVIEEEAC